MKMKYIYNFFEALVIIIIISGLISISFIRLNLVSGNSMYPTFSQNDLIASNIFIDYLIDNNTFGNNKIKYKRGDIIIFKKNKEYFIKRITALGGDKIKIEDNQLFVNGQISDESYLSTDVRTLIPEGIETTFKEGQEIVVPENKYFVLGDNREISKDSRYSSVGFIDGDMIDGKVFLKLWPLKEFHFIHNSSK